MAVSLKKQAIDCIIIKAAAIKYEAAFANARSGFKFDPRGEIAIEAYRET